MSERTSKRSREPNPEERRFGRHVRLLRRARGLTQEILAERSGLSADTIRRLEYGSFSPSHETLRKLCRGLGLRLSTLFLGFELAERDLPSEIIDSLLLMDAEEQARLLRLLSTAVGLLRDSSELVAGEADGIGA